MFCHPDVKRLEGRIEDRPSGKSKGNNTALSGRVIRVLGQSGAFHDLFLPLAGYGIKRVEETDEPVTVFYLDWKHSGFSPDQVFSQPLPSYAGTDLGDKSYSALGVYIGFRPNPALTSKKVVWTQPVEKREA